MELYVHQQWFRHDILKALKDHDSVLAVLPTGGGKRYSIVDLCLLAMKHDRQVLVATNRRLLVDQMVKECEAHGVRFGVLMADYPRGNPYGNIQIASIQSLQSWFMKRGLGAKYGEGIPEFTLLLIDEGHSSTKSYKPLRELRPEAKVVAFTATPVGLEGAPLTPHTFSTMVEGAKNSELIAAGYLLPTRVFSPSEPEMKNVTVSGGREYNQSQLSRSVRECTCGTDVFREFDRFPGRSAVVFAPGVPFARSLEEQFNARYGAGFSRLIEAGTSPNEREDLFGSIKDGSSTVIVSVDIMREGADLPILSLALDLTPNRQFRTLWQKVGRIKRPYGDQKDAVWIDLAGNIWEHGIHPDQDPVWPEGEETTADVSEKIKSDPKQPEPIICPKCGHMRLRGPACPECGFECQQSVRHVRTGIGTLREVKASELKVREKSPDEQLFLKWQQKLFAAFYGNMTYGQAAHLFSRETGSYPKSEWPMTFERDSLEWRKRPSVEHTKGTLYSELKHYQEKLRK